MVLANDAEDGVVAPGIDRFAENVDVRLTNLRSDVLAREYRPAPLTAFQVPKDDEGTEKRELHIPGVRDRVLERALVDALRSSVDPLLSPWSFGFRPGLGVADAVRALVEEREGGTTFCLRTDIESCFDHVPHVLIYEALRTTHVDEAIIGLITLLCERRTYGQPHDAQPATVGIPQGRPLSPMLMNLVLDRYDRRMAKHGFHTIRYADDVTVPTKTRQEAQEAMQLSTEILADLGMTPNEDKTEVMSFSEGFAFLGEDVNTRYPSPTVLEERREPERKALYVSTEGAVVRIEKGQIHVSDDHKDLLVVPSSHVGAMCLIGSVGLSAGARQYALSNEVDVTFLSRRGQFQGWLQSATGPGFGLRRNQYRVVERPSFAAAMASRIVAGKIANMRALLLRYGNRDGITGVVEDAHDLDRLWQRAVASTSVDEARGIEGAASAAYFKAFSRLVPEPFSFESRNRQPPRDPVNALMSFGYTITLSHIVGAVASCGLDPTAGFLHVEDATRPSLALDLLEEFRPLIVDTTVLNVLRRGILTPQHFRADDPKQGTRLTEQGRKRYLAALEDRVLELFGHVPSGKRVSYRRSFFLQARSVANAINAGQPDYEPVSWR